MDTELDRIHLHVDTPCGAKSSKKSMFGSIERGMDRLLCMLTPKKRLGSMDEGPRKVKVGQSLVPSVNSFKTFLFGL